MPEAVDSYLKAEDATDYLEVIQAAEGLRVLGSALGQGLRFGRMVMNGATNSRKESAVTGSRRPAASFAVRSFSL